MIYSLLVTSSPACGQSNRHAVRFATALLAAGHTVRRVFFLDQGTLSGAQASVFPQDEANPIADWQQLASEDSVELTLCITSALRYGMLDASEAARYEKQGPTVPAAFTIAGLGDLIEACAESDRVVTFGA